MSSLHICAFRVFETDPTKVNGKFSVDWEKGRGYVVSEVFKYRNQATDIYTSEEIGEFPESPKGLRAAIARAQKLFFERYVEYGREFCTPVRVVMSNET